MRALGVWVALVAWLAVACGAADDSPDGGSSATGGSAAAGAGGNGAAAAGGSTATGGSAGAGGQAATPTVFSDGFESADMSATNPEGFAWSNNNRTSVVTADAAVWNNGVIDNARPAGSDWTPFEGAHSLRFRYPANDTTASAAKGSCASKGASGRLESSKSSWSAGSAWRSRRRTERALASSYW